MSKSAIFVASKEQALEIHEMDKSGDLPADILRVSGLSVVREKFERFSQENKVSEQSLNQVDLNEIALALNQEWILKSEVTDDVLAKLEDNTTV